MCAVSCFFSGFVSLGPLRRVVSCLHIMFFQIQKINQVFVSVVRHHAILKSSGSKGESLSDLLEQSAVLRDSVRWISP